jgi:hypothetical protein
LRAHCTANEKAFEKHLERMDTAHDPNTPDGDLRQPERSAGEGHPLQAPDAEEPITQPMPAYGHAAGGTVQDEASAVAGADTISGYTPHAAPTPRTGRLFDDEDLEEELGREVVMSAGPRRTAETEAAYTVRVRQLYNGAALRRGISKDLAQTLPPGDVVQDLIETGSQRSLASWRLYRSALLWHLAQHRRHSPEHLAAYEWLVATKLEPAGRDHVRARSRQGKNTIPEKDLKLLMNTLAANAMRSRARQGANWAERTQYWLHASLATGLRPNEWESAHWANEGREVLMAPNSKAKLAEPAFRRVEPGRSVYDEEFPPLTAGTREGEGGAAAGAADGAANPAAEPGGHYAPGPRQVSYRSIPVPEDARDWVSLHLDSIRDSGVDFSFYYERCRQALWRACKIAFKGKVLYSLYTMRSQWAANAKASMPLDDVGAMMGHSDPSNKTTKRNYGPRKAAHGAAWGPQWVQANNQSDGQSEQAEQTGLGGLRGEPASGETAIAPTGDVATG